MKSLLAAGFFLSLLCACATSRPDHFYILSPLPQGAGDARTTPATQMWLRVTLPSLVDRSEMVLNTSTNLGGAISPMLTPWIAQRLGWVAALDLAAGFMLCIVLLWFLIHPERRIDTD